MWRTTMLALFVVASAHADDFGVLNVAAHHWNRGAVQSLNLNEKNFGVGYEHHWGNGSMVMLGVYDNSLRRPSTYGLVGYAPLHIGIVSIGGAAGYVTGYPVAPLIPALGALVMVQHGDVGVNVLLVPSMESVGVYGFAGFQLKLKLYK